MRLCVRFAPISRHCGAVHDRRGPSPFSAPLSRETALQWCDPTRCLRQGEGELSLQGSHSSWETRWSTVVVGTLVALQVRCYDALPPRNPTPQGPFRSLRVLSPQTLVSGLGVCCVGCR